MSEPANQLDFFRTYSYHHVLVACDYSDTANQLMEASELSLFEHPSTRFCPKSAPSGAGKYVILINGMSDAQFSVESAKWTMWVNSDARSGGAALAGSAGELIINEPQGVNLLNVMAGTAKSLGVDTGSIIYLLKTIFVGITHDGEVTHLTNIKPYDFIIYKIESDFDISGAVYKLHINSRGLSGGSSVPQATIFTSFATKFPSGGTNLKSFIENDFTSQVKDYYERQRAALVATAQQSGDSVFVRSLETDYLSVEYKFTCDDFFETFTDVGSNIPPNKLDTGDNDGQISQTSQSSMSIEQLLEDILASSQKLVEECNKTDADHYKNMYKITSSIETELGRYVVHYHVHHYKLVCVPSDITFTYEPPDSEKGIIFDYVFTGKNVDILDMNMHMNMAMAFFQALAANNSLATSSSSWLKFYQPDIKVPGTGSAKVVSAIGANETDSTCGEVNDVKRPLFLGSTAQKHSIRNVRAPADTTKYSALFSRWAGLESIGVVVKIRGNPQLMSDSLHADVITATDPTDPPTIDVSGDVPNEEDKPRTIFRGLTKYPGFVKVRVKMPRAWMATNDDPTGDSYAVDFWYTGWYMLLNIENSFDHGEFTQTMKLVSLINDDGQYALGSQEETSQTNTASSASDTNVKDSPGKIAKDDNVLEKDVRNILERRASAGHSQPPGTSATPQYRNESVVL